MSDPLNPLTKGQQEFCTWAGIFGALIGAAAQIQHLVFALPSVTTRLMNAPYLYIIGAFVVLAMQKVQSPAMLIVAAVLAFVNCFIVLISGAFSPLIIILMLYTVVITVFVYVEKIQLALRKKLEVEKAEEDRWKGVI